MLNVLYCVDSGDRGRKWMEVSINSLVQFVGKDGVRVFVASDSPYSRPECTYIDANPYIQKLGLQKISSVTKNGIHPSPMQIFRIAAPCVEELQGLDRVLYMDIDTEVVSFGLERLAEVPLVSDVMALFEHSQHGNDSTRIMLKDKELLGMMSPDSKSRLEQGGYFNSGVMLMNLEKIRREHPCWEKEVPFIVEMAVKHHRIVVDQDICNVVFTASAIPPEFNVMPDTDVYYGVKNPCVVHYASWSKYKSSVYPPPDVRAMALRGSALDVLPTLK